MVNAATQIEHPIQVEETVLRLYPSPAGMQHDECKAGIKGVTRWFGRTWKLAHRKLPDPNVRLHPSVYERFQLPGVLHYDVVKKYRPETLKDHADFKDHPDYRS
jgi:hypothetical protein